MFRIRSAAPSNTPVSAARPHQPGVWMMHCHIAEHHESGMMFSFTVEP
ncbi:multicopper oxidase domain-containing protein [Mycobacterium sp.]